MFGVIKNAFVIRRGQKSIISGESGIDHLQSQCLRA